MNEIVIYKKQDQKAEVEVISGGETVWLSLNQIARLFAEINRGGWTL